MTKTATIIGAGVAGCTTAYVLAKHGIAVTLIERNTQIANAASGNPLAMLYPRLSGDELTSEFALTSYIHSLAFYQSLQLPESDFFACGMLQLGFNARELSRIKKVASKKAKPKKVVKKAAPKKAAKKTAAKKVTKQLVKKVLAKKVAPKKIVKKAVPKKSVKVSAPKKVASKFKK